MLLSDDRTQDCAQEVAQESVQQGSQEGASQGTQEGVHEGSQKVVALKKKILRYLLLSWTMAMTDFNGALQWKYDRFGSPYLTQEFTDAKIISKELATDEEMKTINRYG